MKLLRFLLLALASLIVFLIIDQYLFCPVFTFAQPTPFSGDSLYNPYATATAGNWVKCNFHAHVHCWEGVTNGCGTADDIYRVYNQLHYGVHAVSNYEFIDTTGQSSLQYISSYEHGYNLLKSHQLVVGAHAVCWKDYLFPQTASNKQDIINRIRTTDSNALIIINHPMVRKSYCASNLAHLTQYNCMEVLHHSGISSSLWDVALSAGKPIFIVGDDDAHNFADTNRIGSICTWINVSQTNSSHILKAMKTGCSYAMTVGKNLMLQERQGNNKNMPVLQSFIVKKDTVEMKFSLPAKEIIASGENGHLISKIKDTNSFSFVIGKQEPYARVVADYGNGAKLYLNPVFRFTESPLQQATVGINSTQTLVNRMAGTVVLIFWFSFVFKLRLLKKIKAGWKPAATTFPHEVIASNIDLKNSHIGYYRWLFRYLYRFFDNLGFAKKKLN